MNAIILAAGMGRRFQPQPPEHPKCLLEIGGKTLLARSIEHLALSGCQSVSVVAGYRAELIERALQQLTLPLELNLLYNPNYAAGSAGSVLCAQSILQTRATLMLDADILYDRRILQRVMDAPSDNVILIEQKDESIEPEYWLFAEGGRLASVQRGTVRPPGSIGMYLGIQKFSPAFGECFISRVREMFRENEATEYWYVVPRLFSDMPVGSVDTAGLMFYEIDTWQQFRWAREHIYPQLAAAGQV